MKKILILVSLTFLTACSFKGLIIGNLPYLVTARIDKKIFLNSDQESQLKKDLERYFKVNKEKIKKIESDLKSMKLETSASQNYEELRIHYIDLAGPFVVILSRYLARLDFEQQTYMFKQAGKDNKKFSKRYAEKGQERVIDRFERFFGELTDDQKKLISEDKAFFETLHNLWIKRRVTLQGKLKVILSEKTMPGLKAVKIQELFMDYVLNSTDPSIRQKGFVLFDNIVKTSSNKQKEKFYEAINQLDDWLKVFYETY